MDSIMRPGMTTSVVRYIFLARHIPRVHLSSSSSIQSSPAARDLHLVSSLNDITGLELAQKRFIIIIITAKSIKQIASSLRNCGISFYFCS